MRNIERQPLGSCLRIDNFGTPIGVCRKDPLLGADGYIARQDGPDQCSSNQVALTVPCKIKSRFLRFFRGIQQFSICRVQRGVVNLVVESEPQVNLGGRQGYDVVHFDFAGQALAFMDTQQPLRRRPNFAGIAESVVDIGYAVYLHVSVNVAMPVNMNIGMKSSQLVLELYRAQDRIKKLSVPRNETRH